MTADVPKVFNSGGTVNLDDDTWCGHQIVVEDSGGLFGGTTVNILPGAVVGEDVETIGSPQSILVRGTSRVNMSGGQALGAARAEDNGELFVSGGDITGDLEAEDNGLLDISGGTFGDDLQLFESARANWSGGSFGGFIELVDPLGDNKSWLRIFGDNFQVESSPVGSGDVVPLSGDIDVDLSNGPSGETNLFQRNPTARITLVESTAPDGDTDGVVDPIDNCPGVSNANQADFDGDRIGNLCDGILGNPADDYAVVLADLQATLAATADCGDGVDNDGDGNTDFAGGDLGCTSAADTSERDAGAARCDDGLDNDGDGFFDFPQDAQCANAMDSTEGSCGLGFELAVVLPLIRRLRRRRQG